MDKIIFLHGFLGSSDEFSFFEEKLKDKYQCVSLKIPLDMMRLNLVSMANAIGKQIETLKIEKAHFWGYSLGGRILLELYRQKPIVFKSLVLESSSLGIKDALEKKTRLENDRAWASRIQEMPSKFMDRWYQQDLFKNFRQLPAFEEIKQARLKRLTPKLAKLIVDASPGLNPDYFDVIQGMQTPTLVLAGQDDAAYAQNWSNLVDKSPKVDVRVLPDCGHVIHLERPELALEEFLNFQNKNAHGANI